MTLWCAFTLLPPIPVRASDPPLTAIEEREVLAALEELILVRQERDRLREAIVKAQEQDEAKAAQIAALEKVIALKEEIVAEYVKLGKVRDEVVASYKEIAANERDARLRADARAERAEKLAWLGPIGLLIGLFTGAGGAAVLLK